MTKALPGSRKSPKHPLVLVEWVDSCTTAGWQFVSDISPTAKTCFSVGWIYRQSKQVVQLAASAGMTDSDGFDQVQGGITIPRGAIIRIKKLAKGRL